MEMEYQPHASNRLMDGYLWARDAARPGGTRDEG